MWWALNIVFVCVCVFAFSTNFYTTRTVRIQKNKIVITRIWEAWKKCFMYKPFNLSTLHTCSLIFVGSPFRLYVCVFTSALQFNSSTFKLCSIFIHVAAIFQKSICLYLSTYFHAQVFVYLNAYLRFERCVSDFFAFFVEIYDEKRCKSHSSTNNINWNQLTFDYTYTLLHRQIHTFSAHAVNGRYVQTHEYALFVYACFNENKLWFEKQHFGWHGSSEMKENAIRLCLLLTHTWSLALFCRRGGCLNIMDLLILSSYVSYICGYTNL